MFNRIVIDIETLPAKEGWILDEIKAGISPPGNYKKQETIDKWMEENYDAEVSRKLAATALDTNLARIFCIGFKIDDSSTQVIWNENERLVLKSFWEYFDKRTGTEGIEWVSYNGNAFDIPLLWKRSKIHGVPMTRHLNPHPHNSVMYMDVMEEWCGRFSKDRISMDRLCKLFGIPGKGGMSGADVYPAYLEGRMSEIAEYCAEDVERTLFLAERIF